MAQGKVENVYTKLRKTTLTKPTTLMKKTLKCFCGNIFWYVAGLASVMNLAPN